MPAPEPPARESGRARGIRLAALSLLEVVAWGILYYAMIVAAPEVSRQTGWPVVAVTAAFSVGLIVSAVAGIPVGRMLDARGPRGIMTAGAATGVAGVVIVALAPNLVVFVLGWIVCGLAQSTLLYQAAFTVVIRRHGAGAQMPLTVLTLAGGLASTVFAPIVAALLGGLGDWREVFLVLAVVLAAVALPVTWFSLERRWPERPRATASIGEEPTHTVRTVLRTRRFWMLEITTVLVIVASFSATLAAVPLFMEKGFGFELAALGLGLIGAGQVVGRLLFLVKPRGFQPWMPLAIVAVLTTASLALLAFVPGPPWLLLAIGIMAGAVRGAQTLVQASSVADRWGSRDYGAINGVFAAPVTVAMALAPAIGAAVAAGAGSYAAMAAIMAGAALVAAFTARAT